MRHLESNIQRSCVKYFRYAYPEISKLLFAVPNGGSRNRIEASILKGEGVVAGVADMILLISKGSFSSLCIEFKSDKGRQTDLQREWQIAAETFGNKYIICRTFDEFREAIDNYIDL